MLWMGYRAASMSDNMESTETSDATRRIGWDFSHAVTFPLHDTWDPPPDGEERLETGVKNGDCLPACFCAMLEALHHGCIRCRNFEPPSAAMRQHLVSWIVEHWHQCPVFNPDMAVHDIITLAHDLGIPQAERDKFGHWGDDPDARLAHYISNADHLYFSDAEMLLFSCMMFERGVSLCFRTFRSQRRDVVHLSTTPCIEAMQLRGVERVIVIDLVHLGRLDARSAHYKLLEGGSLLGLLELQLDPRPPRPAASSYVLQPYGRQAKKRPRSDDPAPSDVHASAYFR